MSSDPNIFDCLLGSAELFDLYLRIGTILKNSRDIANERGRGKEVRNSLSLLLSAEMIQQCGDEFSKLNSYESFDSFFAALFACIKNRYADEFSTIVNRDKHYDERKNQFYIYINDIPLKYMGLAMLMEQTGEFDRVKNREYFVRIKEYQEIIRKKPLLSIEELQKKLQQDIECGEQAEKFAWEYEVIRLKQIGINKEPLRVSSIDAMAGYDMVSYESGSSTSYDRFIEVKAVSKNGFYWSRNEYETAQLKADKYYLYLVDLRMIDQPGYTPEMIQNPALKVMKSDSWFVEAQSYRIRRV